MTSLDRYRTFVVFASVAIFFTNFSDYSQRWGLIPLFWIVALGGLAAPLLVPALFTAKLQVQPLVFWSAGYVLASIAWYFPSVQTGASFQDLQLRILSVLFLGMMLFILARPADQPTARRAVAYAVCLAVGLNVYELFNPFTFSTVPGRSSGLYADPNQSGAALILGMIIGYGVVPPRLRIAFISLTAVGIITTFSRAAIVGWVLVVLYLAMRSGLGLVQIRRIVLLCAVVLGFLVSPLWSDLQHTLEERGTLTLDVIQRLNFLSGNGGSDASSQERSAVATYAWRLFSKQPITGYGTGQHRQLEGFAVSTHNVYLAMMVDHGILGLFFLPALIGAALWGLRPPQYDLALPFAMFLSLWGLFSHNVLEERYILVSVALVGAIVAANRQRAAEPWIEPAPAPVPIAVPA